MDITTFIGYLEYELRMLLGAAKLVELLDKYETGNTINYFKDAAYLHSRNLYNFFAANTRNDAKITDYGFSGIAFDLSTYNKWIGPLHDHVLHIKASRTSPTNVIGTEHLNEQVELFASDIVNLWSTWISTVSDPTIKQLLKDALNNAQLDANNDYENLEKKLSRSL